VVSTTLTEILVVPAGKVFLHDIPDLKTVCAYCVDRKPERNNLACGEIYRTQIARYKRRVRYGCLGAQSIVSDDKSVAVERYFTQSHLSTVDGILLCPRKEFVDSRRGFRAKPSNTLSPPFIPLSMPESDAVTYRQDADGPREEDRAALPVGTKRSVELNRLLADNPHDISSWLELVRCQNSEVAGDSLSQGSTPDKVASAVADIKAAILDRALGKNPSSIELKLAQLELCHGRWEVEKMAAEWKNMVFQHASDPYVWNQYLRYVRSSFKTFSSSRVTSAYVRAISTLRGARDGTLLSHKAPPHVTTHIIGKCFCYRAFVIDATFFGIICKYCSKNQQLLTMGN